jgi:hypothetical protein
MEKLSLLLSAIVFLNFQIFAVPIKTPHLEESNKFMINSPGGWGYRTFRGDNGLIGTLWPAGTSFNATDTVVFVFLQNNSKKLPKIPDNIDIFKEKCRQASFNFFQRQKKSNNATLSLSEKYFSGRCGRTMILFKEVIENYTVVIALISGGYVTKKQVTDVKEVASAYKKEIEKYINDSRSESESKTTKSPKTKI